MVVRWLEMNKDLFHPKEDNKELFGLKVPYFSVMNALMYFENYTWLDIAFFVNLLARYSSTPTQRHWNRVKHVLWWHKPILFEMIKTSLVWVCRC